MCPGQGSWGRGAQGEGGLREDAVSPRREHAQVYTQVQAASQEFTVQTVSVVLRVSGEGRNELLTKRNAVCFHGISSPRRVNLGEPLTLPFFVQDG